MVVISRRKPEVLKRGISYLLHASPAFFLVPSCYGNGNPHAGYSEQEIDEILSSVLPARPREVNIAGWTVCAWGHPSPWTDRALVLALRRALAEGPAHFAAHTVYCTLARSIPGGSAGVLAFFRGMLEAVRSAWRKVCRERATRQSDARQALPQEIR